MKRKGKQRKRFGRNQVSKEISDRFGIKQETVGCILDFAGMVYREQLLRGKAIEFPELGSVTPRFHNHKLYGTAVRLDFKFIQRADILFTEIKKEMRRAKNPDKAGLPHPRNWRGTRKGGVD